MLNKIGKYFEESDSIYWNQVYTRDIFTVPTNPDMTMLETSCLVNDILSNLSSLLQVYPPDHVLTSLETEILHNCLKYHFRRKQMYWKLLLV